MILAFLLATAPAVADPLSAADVLPEKCTSADPTEVVVCGSREKSRRYRLPTLPDEYKPNAIRAATTIAGLPARAHVDSVDLPGGQRSNRVMLTISTAF